MSIMLTVALFLFGLVATAVLFGCMGWLLVYWAVGPDYVG